MSGHADSVKEIYEAFGRGDIRAILERLHPEIAWESWPITARRRRTCRG
jgi:ketosteroid isomerase-like protein